MLYSFEKNIYDKELFVKSLQDVGNNISFNENGDFYEIDTDENTFFEIADYYIYIYNENY